MLLEFNWYLNLQGTYQVYSIIVISSFDIFFLLQSIIFYTIINIFFIIKFYKLKFYIKISKSYCMTHTKFRANLWQILLSILFKKTWYNVSEIFKLHATFSYF